MKKSKIILGCISVMIFVLTLFVCLPSKVYASEVETISTEEYIEENFSNLSFSNNLFNNYNVVYGNSVNIISIDNDKVEIETIGNWARAINNIDVKPNTTYTFSAIIIGGNNSALRIEQLSRQSNVINGDGLANLTFNSGNNTRLQFELYSYLAGNYNSSFITSYSNIMLNEGTTALPYEPYITGSMIYNQGYQQGLLVNASSALYKAFNGATAKLLHNNEVVESDSIVLSDDDLYLDIANFPNIFSYLNDDETNRHYSLSISLNSAINNELVVLLNNSILDTTLTLSNSMGGYQESFSRLESSLYTIIANSQGRYFDTIIYDALYAPDYIDFKLNLDLSQLTFQEGYDAGVEDGFYNGSNQGYQDGYYKGYDAGELKGYQDGYNDGTLDNIEVAGMRTLFNSILSYPVNMISTIFDFDFMGVNITSLIMFIVSLAIVIFVVKKFW